MTASLTALAAKPVPAYCSNIVKTPAQWKACWNAGWSHPTTGAANAGFFAGHDVAPYLIIALIAVVIFVAATRGSRSPATSRN